MARDRWRGAGTFKGRRTGPPGAQKRLEGRAGSGREREMWREEKVEWRGIKWASPGVTSGRCPGNCPLLSTPPRACDPCTAPPPCPPGARAPEPPVRRARRRKPGPRRRRESSRSYYCPSSSTLPRPTGTRVHGLPGSPPTLPRSDPPVPTPPQSCSRGVGTCTELQADAVATRAAAARAAGRARAVPDDGGEGRRRRGGGGRGRRRRRRSPRVAGGRGGRAGRRRRRGGGGGGGPACPGRVGRLRRERRRRRLAAADGHGGERREGRRRRRRQRGRPRGRQLQQRGSVVALGQRRPPAGERLEDAVGAALLVDAGRAGPLLRRLHLGLHAEPEALPAPRAAPGVARPPGRPIYPGARRREGVCLRRGGRRRCRRLSPSLASPSPRAGGCRPALIDSPPRQCLEGERR